MHTYTHNPYEISTPITPRDEASSSNQQLVNTEKTPDRPANMDRIASRTRINLNEKLLSEAQEAALVAWQEFLKKQDNKREADRLLVQIAEEENRALIIYEAMQQAVQIEKQAQESARAAKQASALTLMTQNNMKNNVIIRKQALQNLQNNNDKKLRITLGRSKEALKLLQEDYKINVASSSITNNSAAIPPRKDYIKTS